MKNLIILILTFLFLIPITSYAQIDNSGKKISVQGFLKDANGKAVPDAEYNITFRIYNDLVGGTNLWTGSQAVNVFGGVYTAQIDEGVDFTGNENIFIGDLEWDLPYYLSVEINNNGVELQPRTALTYSPYAYAVNKAQIAIIAETVECSGAVGDVKYSILDYTAFQTVNGDCWVPLDGQAPLSGTKLFTAIGEMGPSAYNNAKVPDLSGLFIRGHEHATSPKDYDSNRTSSDAVAVFQDEETGPHNHTMQSGGAHTHSYTDFYFNGTRFNWGSGNTEEDGVGKSASASRTTLSEGDHTHTINASTGSESRPKNLSFYAYIRIN